MFETAQDSHPIEPYIILNLKRIEKVRISALPHLFANFAMTIKQNRY